MLTTQLEAKVEDLIGAVGVSALLDAIGSVCLAKGEHIRSTWDDRVLASCWDHVEVLTSIARSKLPLIPGIR
jgi:hypothetical protein